MKVDLENSATSQSNNICITGVPEDEEREQGAEGLFQQITAENFPIWGRIQSFKSKKHRGLPLDSTKTNHQQGISQSNSQNTQAKRNMKAPREKSP